MDNLPCEDLDAPLRRLYHKKALKWQVGGRTLRLAVPVDVFSSFQVDTGTKRLLRLMSAAKRKWARTLDLGCGYGPIGLYLAATGLAGAADAIDRDALAVDFARANARDNGLGQVAARGAIAYEHVTGEAYDAVVTNLPAKAGRSVHQLMLLGAQRHLRPGGQVWAVVVAPLEESIDEILACEAVQVVGKTRRAGHVVYNYTFAAAPQLPAAPYVRGEAGFTWKGLEYSMTSLHGLAEFDTRNRASDLLVEAFRHACRGGQVRAVSVCDPGQGHVAVLACKIAEKIEDITLVSRDLLALQATRANLLANGYQGALRCAHTADFRSSLEQPRPDVVLARIHEGEGTEVSVEKVRRLLAADDGCRVIVACKSSYGSRLLGKLKGLGFRASAGRKRKGFRSAVVTRRK